MAKITIELKCNISWWVIPLINISGFVNKIIPITEEKVIAFAMKGVKIEAIK